VVLLSGGLDSATTLAFASKAGFLCDALTFSYGQRHRREIDSADRVAQAFSVRHHLTMSLDTALFEGSALTGFCDVPKDRDVEHVSSDIPNTYVPARNTVFLSLALAYAEHRGAFDIFIGANAVDYSGYPDCRPEYIAAFETMANLATKAAVTGQGRFRIHTPLIDKTKAQIVQMALDLGVDPAMTWSCYSPLPDGRPCCRCDSCQIRRRAFEQLGLSDPVD
jgi:7-cyano-7-deazaguanine synthase